MPDREAEIDKFLESAGWKGATRSALAGDASSRRYWRVNLGHQTSVLMDAKSDVGDNLNAFVTIGQWLTGIGLSAPKILHADMGCGLLLLEDLGNDLFAKVIQGNPTKEIPLYKAATDVLISIQQNPAPKNVIRYDPSLMAEQSAIAYEWYLRGTGQPHSHLLAKFQAEIQQLLESHCAECDVLIMRDYHAENLLWLPQRQGLEQVGLLDFQDAMQGHSAYDLVSLLQDARRDVSEQTEAVIVDYFITATGVDPDPFRAAYSLLGVQRNLRILGIFARLCLHSGKAHYVDFMPRVWGYLLRDLKLPAFCNLRQTLLKDLPPPDPIIMEKLKAQCATIQKL